MRAHIKVRHLIGVGLVAGAIGAAAGPASALLPGQGLVVSANDSQSKTECTMTVKSVDYANGVAQIKLSGTIRPDGLLGYFNDASVVGVCDVESSTAGQRILFANSSGSTASGSKTFTLPLESSYQVCAAGQTTTKSGHTYTSNPVCKNS